MPRYGDLDKLQDIFREKCACSCPCCQYFEPNAEICTLIDEAPTIEPTTVYEFKGCDNCELDRPKGKWKLVEHGKNIDVECPFCGYERCNLSYGYTMEEVLKQIAEEETLDDWFPNFCEKCGARMER